MAQRCGTGRPRRGERARAHLDHAPRGVRPASGMTPVLEARALGRRFGRKWALRDCTLAIPAGAVVGLAGPNGAGKSTLLELAVALLAPLEGEIRTLGADPLREPGVIARVGYVAQDAPLYRTFTIGDTFAFARATN